MLYGYGVNFGGENDRWCVNCDGTLHWKQDFMTQNEGLSVGNAHSPRGGGHTNNPTSNTQGKA